MEPIERQLGQAARERATEELARLDERWDALAGGALSPEEAAELAALAETDAEAALAAEAFLPLGPAFEATMVSTLAAQLRRECAHHPQAPPTAPVRGPRRRLWMGFAALATAAGLTGLWLRLPSPGVPAYTLAVTGAAEERGGEAAGLEAPVLLVPGAAFELVLTPEQPQKSPPAVRFFLERGGALEAVMLAVEPSPQGALRVRCRVAAPDCLPATDGQLWTVLGRPGRLPSAAELATRAATTEPPIRQEGWTAWRSSLRLRGAS
jgi:hypothetical protein